MVKKAGARKSGTGRKRPGSKGQGRAKAPGGKGSALSRNFGSWLKAGVQLVLIIFVLSALWLLFATNTGEPQRDMASSGEATSTGPINSAPLKGRTKAVTKISPPPHRDASVQSRTTGREREGSVVLIIDDLGLKPEATTALAKLEGPLTLAFLPYADALPAQTRLVASEGHELLVHLPMEPHSKTADPGPMALLSGLDDKSFNERLRWNLSRFDGYSGVNNHMGSKLTEDEDAMRLVMRELSRRKLSFLDSRTSGRSVAEDTAIIYGVPHLARDVFLDNVREEGAIAANFAELERIARATGLAVGIGHPYDETISALQKWMPEAKARGIDLIPLSNAVKKPHFAGRSSSAGFR